MNAALEPLEPGRPPVEGRARFDEPRPDALTHPEEMKARVDLRIGEAFALSAAARLTPAGLVCAGLAAAATLLSAAALIRGLRRRANG